MRCRNPARSMDKLFCFTDACQIFSTTLGQLDLFDFAAARMMVLGTALAKLRRISLLKSCMADGKRGARQSLAVCVAPLLICEFSHSSVLIYVDFKMFS